MVFISFCDGIQETSEGTEIVVELQKRVYILSKLFPAAFRLLSTLCQATRTLLQEFHDKSELKADWGGEEGLACLTLRQVKKPSTSAKCGHGQPE